jgi:glycosyltransferase involved in cell wall biosynthesis
MTEVLHNLLNNPKRLQDLSNLALTRSKHFSWEKAAKETIEVYS